MDYSDFIIDPASSAQARQLADNLRDQHDDMLNRQIPASFQTIFGFSMDQLTQRFAEPLEKLEKEMALNDIRSDVVDFGLLAAAVSKKTEYLPVMLLEANVEPEVVPLLPTQDSLTFISASDLFDSNPDSLFGEMLPNSRSSRQKYEMRPFAWVQKLFFKKLSDFLISRIAGTRFHERQVELGKGHWTGRFMYATAGGGGGGFEFNHPEQQEWKVVARKSTGHSVYYTPIHARRPFGDRKTRDSFYLNGLTPSVDVLLDYGEVYLGSDISTADDDPIVWDSAKLDVPRSIREGEIPMYYAMNF